MADIGHYISLSTPRLAASERWYLDTLPSRSALAGRKHAPARSQTMYTCNAAHGSVLLGVAFRSGSRMALKRGSMGENEMARQGRPACRRPDPGDVRTPEVNRGWGDAKPGALVARSSETGGGCD